MANTHETLTSLFDDIADAIREKDGTSEEIVADTFPERIQAIPQGTSGKFGNGIGQISTMELMMCGNNEPSLYHRPF